MPNTVAADFSGTPAETLIPRPPAPSHPIPALKARRANSNTPPHNLGDLGTFTLPLASSTINETDSIVRVQDGSIVAIGGLMSQQQNTARNGLPGISGLPGVGLLFGEKSVSNSKRELVILMRSTVIRGENSWREAASEAQDRVQKLDPRQARHIEWQ